MAPPKETTQQAMAIPSLRPKDLAKAIEAYALAPNGKRRTLHIWGPPGIGKSAIVKQVTEKRGIGLIDLRMALLDPTDLRGIPIAKDGEARWLPPTFLPNEKRDGKEGILFLDEMNAAPPLTQSSGYQLTLDRRLGEYALPAGWAVVAAGNRTGDRGVVHRMPSPLRNRMMHFELEVSLEDWTEWAAGHDVPAEVIAFLRFKPDLLFAFDPSRDDVAFPTPRSWEFVGSVIAGPSELRSAGVASCVGPAAAAMFGEYMRVWQKLPDIQAILDGGNTVPDGMDLRYATVTSLALRAEKKHLPHLIDYSMKYPAEFATLLVTMLKPKWGPQIVALPEFKKWMGKYTEYIL